MAEEGDGESKPHIIIDNGTGYCKAGLRETKKNSLLVLMLKLKEVS